VWYGKSWQHGLSPREKSFIIFLPARFRPPGVATMPCVLSVVKGLGSILGSPLIGLSKARNLLEGIFTIGNVHLEVTAKVAG
jgi:hypothetical protein